MHGLLIAAPKDVVVDMVRAVERASLHVAQVDLSCFAALRAAAHLAEDTEAVIDIGANGTNIIIHTDGVPQIVRTIPRGGAEITRLMASRLGMPHGEAETLKCRVGLIAGEGPDSAEVIAEAIRPLISEIRSSLGYFASSRGTQQRVTRLALVGGAARLPGLADELRDALGRLDLPRQSAAPGQRLARGRPARRAGALPLVRRRRDRPHPRSSCIDDRPRHTPTPATRPRPGDEARVVTVFANLLPDEVVAGRRLRSMQRNIVFGLFGLVVLLIAAVRRSRGGRPRTRAATCPTSSSAPPSLQNRLKDYGPLLAAQTTGRRHQPDPVHADDQ